jgi:hypothetical protein
MRCPECNNEIGHSEGASEKPIAPRRRDASGRGRSQATVSGLSVADAERRLAELSRLSKPTPPVPRKSAGFLSNLIGIAGGGFLGLAAGYWLLNYFGGPQFDFLHLPLPLVAHTQPPGTAPAEGRAAAYDEATADVDSADASVSSEDFAAPATVDFAVDAAAFDRTNRPTVPDPAVVPASASVDVLPEQSTAGSSYSPSAAERPAPAPTYTTAELNQAVTDAETVLGCPACRSTGTVTRVVVSGVREVNGERVEQTTERQFVCEACRGRPTTRITQDVYRRLCRLAEVATYVSCDPRDLGIWQQRDAIARVLLKAGEDRARLDGIGRLAGHTLNNHAPESRGIVVGGTVRQIEQHESLYYTRIVLFGLPKEVTVVSSSRVPLVQHDRVLIAGAIVDDPVTNLPGFQGKQSAVVWGGLPVRLSDEP